MSFLFLSNLSSFDTLHHTEWRSLESWNRLYGSNHYVVANPNQLIILGTWDVKSSFEINPSRVVVLVPV